MKKPWQIWLVYALSLIIVIPAMLWLSIVVVDLDRARENDRVQTELARREAELQDRINSALWRMDWVLTPLVAQEAARPYYLYESFYPVVAPASTGKGTKGQTAVQPSQPQLTEIEQPSPLLFKPSDYVVLHFQIDPDGQLTSPQRPQGEECQVAIVTCGLTESAVDYSDARLAEIRAFCDYTTMFNQCPSLKLPNAQRSELLAFDDAGQSGAQQNDLSQQLAQQTVEASPRQTMYVEPQFSQIEQQLNEGEKIKNVLPLIEKNPLPKSDAQRQRNLERGTTEWAQRRRSAEDYAWNQWVANNRFNPQMAEDSSVPSSTVFVSEGVMRPLWIDDRLILARRVEVRGRDLIQCCWLDWEKIQETLRSEVSDIIPGAQFEPVRDPDDVNLGNTLATLPVQLIVNTPELLATLKFSESTGQPVGGLSGLRMSLIIAWCGLAFAAVAVAILLGGVIRLSERRAAFVSAVTHELRTPLTSFRMYAEMLAEQMVPSAEKRQQYANTLKVEAERLSHLVENVLQFARLERGNAKARLESTNVGQLMDRFGERLTARAEQAGMEFVVKMDPDLTTHPLKTDPGAVEQILFNLVDNACKYAKSAEDRRIEMTGELSGSRIRLYVSDHGPGIKPRDRARMFLPFRKSDQDAANTAAGVGLGLALCRRMAKTLGGTLQLAETTDGARFVLEIPIG